jgi:segregation and condensation protein B
LDPMRERWQREREVRETLRGILDELIAEYAQDSRGIEIREIAGGFRMGTKPEIHDAVRAFAKSLKPPMKLSLPALETLAVIAYKQPVTVPEISEIRGVDSSGVIATLLDRKLITTAGRKAVIGRPILYKTTKEFLLRFGLKDVSELPSMEEFEKLVAESFQSDLLPATDGDAGDDNMPKNTSSTNDGVGGQHRKPTGKHGHTTEVEVETLDIEVDSGSTEDGDDGNGDSGSNDGVGGQHGKPSGS